MFELLGVDSRAVAAYSSLQAKQDDVLSPHKSYTSDLRTGKPSGDGGAPHPSIASSGTHRILSAAAAVPKFPTAPPTEKTRSNRMQPPDNSC